MITSYRISQKIVNKQKKVVKKTKITKLNFFFKPKNKSCSYIKLIR